MEFTLWNLHYFYLLESISYSSKKSYVGIKVTFASINATIWKIIDVAGFCSWNLVWCIYLIPICYHIKDCLEKSREKIQPLWPWWPSFDPLDNFTHACYMYNPLCVCYVSEEHLNVNHVPYPAHSTSHSSLILNRVNLILLQSLVASM